MLLKSQDNMAAMRGGFVIVARETAMQMMSALTVGEQCKALKGQIVQIREDYVAVAADVMACEMLVGSSKHRSNKDVGIVPHTPLQREAAKEAVNVLGRIFHKAEPRIRARFDARIKAKLEQLAAK
jgi:hypothetical protein